MSQTSFQVSPSKSTSSITVPSPRRLKQPSPQKKSLSRTTTNMPPEQVSKDVQLPKRIVLPYSLIENGRATGPPDGNFAILKRLFPGTKAVEIFPPYLIIQVSKLPPKPWPLSVGGLLLHLTTEDDVDPFDRGHLGRGPKALQELDLHTKVDFDYDILSQVARVFKDAEIQVREIFWFDAFWRIELAQNIDVKQLPFLIAGSPAFYKAAPETPLQEPAALRNKPPKGTEYDDSLYAVAPDALLRPGVMLGSSITIVNGEECFKTTTSGVLIVDQQGKLFITVATHGFESDGLVYHPNPHNGQIIGQIVGEIPNTDISLARLKTGLRYVNETFGNFDEPEGMRISGISAGRPPHLLNYELISMNNPFAGSCDGIILGLGIKVPDYGDKDFIKHQWVVFENGDEPINESCGSPILDSKGNVMGLFRYKDTKSSFCLAISAMELRESGFEICAGIQTF